MTPRELECLERHAAERQTALEVGTHMGVSACRIARALAPGGQLFCVDPWEAPVGKVNPNFAIARREMRRQGVAGSVRFLRGTSAAMESEMPPALDFVFVDGDHSFEGLRVDWRIVLRHLRPGGVVCLHDTVVPAAEPWRCLGSVRFYDDVIAGHRDFRHVETVYSMNVLARVR
jgi:predicted O-methyltransferase YrrM